MGETVQKAVSATKKTTWKYFGSMFMEKKEGEMAMSLHKTAGLFSLIMCWAFWGKNAIQNGELADYAVYTTWFLLGLKGVSTVKDAVVARVKG